ncbi:MAG: PPOX class F420-dependent oxidoreductase [Actinomycetia bacterium]|nr:PPOX class F420-dependent oxidoreductase [Actinomycetes bacterium]
MGQPMTEDQARNFMMAARHTGKLATVRSDGRPHIAAVWFSFDDRGRAVFLTGAETLKARNMQRDPRVSLLVDTEEMPFGWARLDGTAGFSNDPAELVHWATETARRYVGDDRAEEFGSRNGVPGEIVVFIEPTNLTGVLGITD